MELPPSVVKLTKVLDEVLATIARTEKVSLARAGLSPSQAKILSAIASRRETRLTELCLSLGISKSTVSTSLESLERLGLLRRDRRSDDRRVYSVRLTERGRALARRIRQEQEGALARAANELTPYQRKTLASALTALLDALTKAGDRGAG